MKRKHFQTIALVLLFLSVPLALSAESPIADTPKADTPKADTPKADTPKAPFVLNTLTEASLLASSAGLYGSSLWLQTIKPTPSPVTPDASKIPFFDRAYVDKQDSTQGLVSDALLVATFATPAVSVPGRSFDALVVGGTMFAETEFLAYSSSALLKSIVVRYRPYAYGTSDPAILSNSDASSSFPSRHATMAFAAAVFAGRTFDAYNPGSSWSPYVWGGSLGLASLTAALRVTSGNHFLSDIAAGALLGAAEGFLVPELHRNRNDSGSGAVPAGLSFSPLADGAALTLSY